MGCAAVINSTMPQPEHLPTFMSDKSFSMSFFLAGTIASVRRWLAMAAVLLGASTLLLVTDRAGARRSMPAVAVLQQVSTSVLDDAVDGMIAGLEERGFIADKTMTLRRYNAEGDLAQANAIAREIVGGPFDLVLTSSTPSLQAVATANARGRPEGSRLPHVFAAVADPFSAGVGLDRRDPLIHPSYLVGYGSLSPVDASFRLLQAIGPRVRRVGAAHNPAEANSRRFMELARATCAARNLELLEAAVENSSGVVEAVQSTIARGAEVIFVPGDTTVLSVIDSIVAVAAKAKVPVFSLTPGAPDRGTLFDVGYDFREVGLLAGRVAGDILGGTDPTTIPIGETSQAIPPRLTVNLEAPGYDRTVWRVPEAILRQAKIVISTEGRRDQPDAVLEGPFDEPHDPAKQ
jgi:putative ABC transport system substrate-binding protein